MQLHLLLFIVERSETSIYPPPTPPPQLVSSWAGKAYDAPFSAAFIFHMAAAALAYPNVGMLSFWTFTDSAIAVWGRHYCGGFCVLR